MNRLLFLVLFEFIPLIIFCQEQVPYSVSKKEIDGNLHDWNLKDSNCFTVKQKYPFSSNRVCVNTAWDEEYLYVAYRVYDHSFISFTQGNDNPGLCRNDCVEFYIDPLNDSKTRMDINDYQFIFDIGGYYAVLKGDKERIYHSKDRVPKEIGTATIAFNHSVKLFGDINSNTKKDSLYVVEVAIPWAAIGVVPKTGYEFKVDFCNNDADKPENSDTSSVSFIYAVSSITGNNDYGFPDKWISARLTGSPGLFDRLVKNYSHQWISVFLFILIILIVSLVIIVWQFRRINQLKEIPHKEELKNTSFIHLLEDEVKPVVKNGIRAEQSIPQTEKILTQKDISKNAELISDLKKYILENLDRNISTKDLADKSDYTLRHIQRIFKEELDTNPKTFILLLKIEEASRLLKAGNKSISEVAHETGFSDPSYFSKVFKKYFNISPTDFIRN